MRIGIDARSLLETEPSGVSIYTRELIQKLCRLNGEDTFSIFLAGMHVPVHLLRELSMLPRTTVRHLRWPNKLFHGATLLHMGPRIDHLLGGIDVLFAPNLHVLPVSNTVPIVLTVHDLSFSFYPHFLSWQRRLWHTAVQPRNLFDRCRRLIAVSTATARTLQHAYAIAPTKIVTIPSGVPSIATPEVVAALPEHFVVALGTLEPRKNLATLVSAFREYRSTHLTSTLHLVILGAKGWSSRAFFHELRREPNIQYRGYVSPGQKTCILKKASALFYPSINEGFGFPPLEALSLGTPVVVSRAGALPEVLGNAAWYLNPYSRKDIITFLQLFDQVPHQHPRGAQDRWKELTWERTASSILRVLHEAVY